MIFSFSKNLKPVFVASLIISLFLLYSPLPVFSQQGEGMKVQDLIVNGGFEGGFQEEFGVGYAWGGFSNGNAVVGWNYDDWDAVVASGDYSQRIEITDALSQDRYAGIYQTISVVPGQQYKLTIKGLIRSDEGHIDRSDYGYRLEYAIDHTGNTTWELVDESAWQELPWDEQPLELGQNETYQLDTFNTTITAQEDQLTLFIRGWKKWINNGSGVFNLDDIQVVGPAPEGFQAPTALAAAVSSGSEPVAAAEEPTAAGADSAPAGEQVVELPQAETGADEETVAAVGEETSTAQAADQPVTVDPSEAAPPSNEVQSETAASAAVNEVSGAVAPERVAPLPDTGHGEDGALLYVFFSGVTVLLVLFGGAIAATVRQRGGLAK